MTEFTKWHTKTTVINIHKDSFILMTVSCHSHAQPSENIVTKLLRKKKLYYVLKNWVHHKKKVKCNTGKSKKETTFIEATT